MDFYFIDERGNDSTNFQEDKEKYKIASQYFYIGVFKLNNENLFKFQENFNAVRYFLNITKEFDRLLSSRNAFKKLWSIIEHMHYENNARYCCGTILKEKYNGPYLFSDHHRFRIFNIGRIIKLAIERKGRQNHDKAQIIIDRFSMTKANEINAYNYLKEIIGNYYQEVEVAFIDSRCCDYLQIIDVVIAVVDEKKYCKNSKFNEFPINFIRTFNLT